MAREAVFYFLPYLLPQRNWIVIVVICSIIAALVPLPMTFFPTVLTRHVQDPVYMAWYLGLVFGVAAVVALVHDVLVTLGAVALSIFLAPALGPVLMIDPLKINLPLIAAFLTIVGYSINDTIVTFDRLREIRGKSPSLTPAMVNLAINQTLGRTLLTSLTVLLVLLVLYIFGGQGIHGFAYSMIVGCLAGVYSTVFIATPIVLWMMKRPAAAPARSSASPPMSAAAARALKGSEA